MSAFLVSNAHIAVLAQARELTGHCGSNVFQPRKTLQELGQMLLRENMLSLAARYSDPIDEAAIATYRHQRQAPLEIVQIIKAIHCYEYQACEHEGWKTSDAHDYCRALERSLVHQLPGYREAEWGVPESAPPAPAASVAAPTSMPAGGGDMASVKAAVARVKALGPRVARTVAAPFTGKVRPVRYASDPTRRDRASV